MSNSPEDHIRSKPFPKKYKRTFWGMKFTSSGYSTERPGPSHGTHGAPRVSRAPLKAKQRDEAGRASLLPTLCESQGTAHILCLGATGVPHGWSRLPKYSTHLPLPSNTNILLKWEVDAVLKRLLSILSRK